MPFHRTLAEVFTVLLLFASVANSRERLTIDRNMVLRSGSPLNQLPPGAYQIVRADDGDYIVSGAVNLNDTEAWATRMDSTGRSRWQFIDGPSDGWKSGAQNLNRFYGALVLPDNSTLLCGTTHLGKQSVALLVYISAAGKLISEIHLVPKGYVQAKLTSCFKWEDGFGLLGVALEPAPGSGNARATGWLCKLRFPGTIMWNKFSDNLRSNDVMEAPDHSLLIVNWGSKGSQISKVDQDGDVKDGRSVADDTHFMFPITPTSRVHVGYMVDTFHTEFADITPDLRNQSRVTKVNNVGIKKGYALADGSLVVFGSTFRNNAAPNIARVYNDSHFINFAVADPLEAGWINDAVPTGSPNQYVFVRIAGENSVMSWVTFRAE
jgi:hypothetical protein